MKSGVLGIVNGSMEPVQSDAFSKTIEDRNVEACIEVVRSQSNAVNGSHVQYGRAALEEPTTDEKVEMVDGRISIQEEPGIQTRYTEFIAVPNEFVVVKKGSGVFAYDLLASQQPNLEIERAKLDIDSFIQQKQGLVPWKVGFYGNLSEAEKGTVYGEDVLEDTEVGKVLNDSAKNQLGAIYDHDGDQMKINITESGYIEIYQPSNYEEAEFAQWVVDDILSIAELAK